MKQSRLNKTIRNICISGVMATMLLMASCEENTYINPKEYLAKEQLLLGEFYNSMQDNNQSWLDSMSTVAIDTIDHRGTTGMMLFHTKVGTGDSVKVFKRVGYRYIQYQLLRDTLDQPGMYYYTSNEYSNSPVDYITYLVNDGSGTYSTGVPQGVNEAILNMRNGGECRVVVPSTLNTTSSYITTIYDLRVTFLED